MAGEGVWLLPDGRVNRGKVRRDRMLRRGKMRWCTKGKAWKLKRTKEDINERQIERKKRKQNAS